MRKLSMIAALGFASMFAASTLSAQTDTHKGFYGSVGGGYGAQSTNVDFGGGDKVDASGQEATWFAGIGLGVKPQWAFGIDFNYMKSSCDLCSGGNIHLTNSFYTAAATFYPSPTGNFFLKLNLGYAQNEASFAGAGSDTEGGFAAGLGFGYDWQIGKGGFIVKPFANYMAQVSSATYSGGESFTGAKGRAQLMQFGVAIGYKH